MKKILVLLGFVFVGTCNILQADPAGSYIHSCFDCSYNNNILQCNCFKSNGDVVSVKFKVTADKKVKNNNGQLEIETGDGIDHTKDGLVAMEKAWAESNKK